MLLELDKKVELEIIDRALSHIKKVELDPEVKTDGDNFDYWNSVPLDDGGYIDYNVYCGDDIGENNLQGKFEYSDPSKWSWDVSAYAVDPPEEEGGYHQINTDITKYLFSYNKEGNGKVEFE